MANYKKSVAVRVKKPKPWGRLVRLITAYADARVANSWSGGGDPNDVDVLKARLVLTRAELNAHMKWMREHPDSL